MERTLNKTQKEMLALERYFPHYIREDAERLFFGLSIFFLSFSVLFNILIDTNYGVLWPIAEGLFLISFALLLKTILIEAYFHSLRMRLEKEHEISFATLLVIGLHHPKRKDLAKAFFHSQLGKEVAERLGIARESLQHFLHAKEHVESALPVKGGFHDLAGYIHDEDPYLRDFLERIHVSKGHFVASSREAEQKHHKYLSGRVLLHPVFHRTAQPLFSIEAAVRNEIEEFERFYRIIITEQATELIIAFFRQDIPRFVSEDMRAAFLTELIEDSLSAHKERFHGASVILPADVRRYLIDNAA